MTAPRSADPSALRGRPRRARWTLTGWTLTALLTGLPGAADATGTPPTTPPAPTCPVDWRDLDPADLRAAQVTATRATFTDARGADTRLSAPRGARLLQGPAADGRRCSYFVPTSGLPDRVTRGFLPDTQVRATPPGGELAGTWARDANTGLTLTRADGGGWTLTGSLMAALPDGTVGSANLNGPLRRDPDRWTYRDGRCEVRLYVAGAWLIAADNGQCAGPDLGFGGLYHHVR
ncbi:hypothetical protein [Deinococcus depolymerans]|uniref:Uncharacterized protein n=1 Tax=Deinococcus depolymerans TaxID=392408 RepID=A0ABP3M7P0_9DEIO